MANDLFTNGFDFDTLTRAINDVPFVKGVIERAKLFRDEPVNSTRVSIELVDQTLSLVPASPRGAPPDVHPDSTRRLVQIDAPHLKTHTTMLADSWQDRRGFGSADPASPNKERDRMLSEMKQRLQLTIERHRASALNGVILDANGSTLVDLFAAFDVTQQTQSFDLGNAAADVVTKILAAKRKAEAELNVQVPKWAGFASPGFLDAMRVHASVQKALANWEAADDMRQDMREGFSVGGVIWSEIAPVAGIDFLPADTAFLCPVGIPDLFFTYYAPADYLESVNEMGLPVYAKAHLLEMDRGVRLEAQVNPISVITRPRAVIKCTL